MTPSFVEICLGCPPLCEVVWQTKFDPTLLQTPVGLFSGLKYSGFSRWFRSKPNLGNQRREIFNDLLVWKIGITCATQCQCQYCHRRCHCYGQLQSAPLPFGTATAAAAASAAADATTTTATTATKPQRIQKRLSLKWFPSGFLICQVWSYFLEAVLRGRAWPAWIPLTVALEVACGRTYSQANIAFYPNS